MTKFTQQNLIKNGEYLMYVPEGCTDHRQQKFVARFKYGRSGMGSFRSFLIKFFTVEEYFSRHETGEAPLTILESKGYILPHIKRWAKEGRPEALAYIERAKIRADVRFIQQQC